MQLAGGGTLQSVDPCVRLVTPILLQLIVHQCISAKPADSQSVLFPAPSPAFLWITALAISAPASSSITALAISASATSLLYPPPLAQVDNVILRFHDGPRAGQAVVTMDDLQQDVLYDASAPTA